MRDWAVTIPRGAVALVPKSVAPLVAVSCRCPMLTERAVLEPLFAPIRKDCEPTVERKLVGVGLGCRNTIPDWLVRSDALLVHAPMFCIWSKVVVGEVASDVITILPAGKRIV